MVSSFLLGIALKKFKDESITNLEYSHFDCFRIQRAGQICYGIEQSKLLFDEAATRANIIESLKSDYSLFDNLFIYISSHGVQKESIPYIFCYDTQQNDLNKTGLSLETILNSIKKTGAKNVTLIIDACQMPFRQKTIGNIRIITPGKARTHEESFYQQSLFTRGLLRSVARHQLIAAQSNIFARHQKIRKQIFYQSLKQRCLYLAGKTAIGKSYFLRTIEDTEKHSFYISIPKLKNISFDFILSLLSEKLATTEDSQWMDLNGLDPEKHVRFYSMNHPHATFLIDHFDHLDSNTASKLHIFLNELPTNKLIATQRCPSFINEKQSFEFPELSPQDVTEFIQQQFPENNELLNVAEIKKCTNYISLLNAIHFQKQSLQKNETLNKACKSIAVCGGFIQLESFAKHFQIKPTELYQLINQGLINLHKQFYYPHDFIYEEKISEHELTELKEKAKSYWKEEVIQNPLHPMALHNYILLLDNFEFGWDEKETPLYLSIIPRLKGRQNSYYLLTLYSYLIKHPIPDSLRTSLCDALIECGRFDHAACILKDHFHDKAYFSLAAELLWWQGDFQSCIEKSSSYLSQHPESPTKLLCSRGIGYFFQGQWPEASSDLNQVISNAPIEEAKERYLAYCVLATLQGLRGTDFKSSVKNFIEAIKIARQAGQLAWIAIIYGNIGEIFWKAGYIRPANETLKTADHLAYLTDNEALRLEINRNLLHTFYRGENIKASQKQLKALDIQMKEQSENYVKMQIINSLLTHYIFFKKENFQTLVSQAIKLTENNEEYSIYTLSNIALIALADSKVNHAFQIMTEALTLCEKGENWLAMKQCLDDWDTVIKTYHLHQPYSKQAFQKWHQVIQIKLLPGLHHLEDLIAFLQPR